MKTTPTLPRPLPSLIDIKIALSDLTGYPAEKFAPDFKLLDCAREIEALENRFDVVIEVRNYINTTVGEVMKGMRLPRSSWP
jgi:hypothetical protein